MPTTTTRFRDLEITTTVESDSFTQRFAVVAGTPTPPPIPPPTPAPSGWTWPKPTTGIFVAPAGTSSGAGTPAQPVSLEKALALSGAGQQIWLRGGTYTLAQTISPRLAGTAGAPWKIHAYPGEEPVININTAARHGLLFDQATAGWQEWCGIRFTDLSTGSQGGTPYDLVKFNFGHDISFLHCQFDNCKWSGILANGPAANLLFYGCIIRNNGVNTQNGDHGIYLKSKAGTFTIENCFLINNAGHAIHAYNGSTNASEGVQGVSAIDNIILGYGEPMDRPILFWDSHGPAKDCVARGNVCFNQFPGVDQTDMDRSSVKVVNGANARVEGNSIWGGDITTTGSVTRQNNVVMERGDWPNRQVWVRKSKHDDGICHVAIFNPRLEAQVMVDLSGILPAGKYEVRAASSPQKLVTSGAYPGTGSIMVPTAVTYDKQVRAGGYDWKGNGKAVGYIVKRVP